MARQEMTRLDHRMSRKQRDLFEQAAEIGGYKSLNDFVLAAASEKAEAIIQSIMPGFLLRMIGRFSLMQLSILTRQM